MYLSTKVKIKNQLSMWPYMKREKEREKIENKEEKWL